MLTTDLQDIADAVVRRAERQRFVTPEDVHDELAKAGLPENLWKDALALARPSLSYRQGRYHFVLSDSACLQQEQYHQERVHQAVRDLITYHREEDARAERREEDRLDFIQSVEVHTADGRQFTFLSRDVSATGIRLIGTRRLLGQKVRVRIPRGDTNEPLCFFVRILWTCNIGEDLVENGGMFLDTDT